MPRCNRVTPFGRLEADPARGALMGNRGILHDATGRLGEAQWRHRAWIACALAFKGQRRALLQPGAYTELFFLDEATAFAAGHRPCALCRRADFERFRRAWAAGHSPAAPLRAVDLDAALHAARIVPGTRERRLVSARPGDLPDGAMVVHEGAPGRAALWWEGRLLPWSHAGYGLALAPDRDAPVAVITPAPTLAAFAAGYRAEVHDSARAGGKAGHLVLDERGVVP